MRGFQRSVDPAGQAQEARQRRARLPPRLFAEGLGSKEKRIEQSDALARVPAVAAVNAREPVHRGGRSCRARRARTRASRARTREAFFYRLFLALFALSVESAERRFQKRVGTGDPLPIERPPP